MQNLSLDRLRNAVDEVRAQIAPKNETERRVYEAISNKNWGASSTLLNDIAADIHTYENYAMVMRIIWDSLNAAGRSWRQIFKTLALLEHLIKNGPERIVEDARDHMFKIRTLSDFNYYEGNVDRGAGVREKAKQIMDLLSDNAVIRDERASARRIREKLGGAGSRGMRGFGGGGGGYSGGGYSGGGGGGYSDGGYSGGGYAGNSSRSGGGYSDSPYGGPSAGGPPGRSRYADESSGQSDFPAATQTGNGSTYTESFADAPAAQPTIAQPPAAQPQVAQGGAAKRRGQRKKGAHGPIKVKINAIDQPAAQQAAAPAAPAQGDFLGGSDLLGGGEPAPTGGGFADFGAAGTAPASQFAAFDAPQQPAAAAPQAFDAFGMSQQGAAPQPQPQAQPQAQAQTFDAFGTAPAAQAPAQQMPAFGQAPAQPQAQPQALQQGFGQFPAGNDLASLTMPAAPAPQAQPQAGQMQPNFLGMTAPSPQLQGQVPPQQDEFGAFEGVPNAQAGQMGMQQPQQAAPQKRNSIENAFGGLVDLGGIAANKKQEPKKQADAKKNDTAFNSLGLNAAPMGMAAMATMGPAQSMGFGGGVARGPGMMSQGSMQPQMAGRPVGQPQVGGMMGGQNMMMSGQMGGMGGMGGMGSMMGQNPNMMQQQPQMMGSMGQMPMQQQPQQPQMMGQMPMQMQQPGMMGPGMQQGFPQNQYRM